MITLRLLLLIVLTFSLSPLHAQFIDHFNGTGTPDGWTTVTGDGSAKAWFTQKNGIASLNVDATRDTLNIWWAITRHRVTGLDMEKLVLPEYELRVEARIRVSHAPRRVNLHVNHQRTTDFHSHLMEFDIPDTLTWHTISMTTRDFETQPGDQINAHLALMDWGTGSYRIDFDYFKVDVVNRNSVSADLGNPLPYHPPIADPQSFKTVVSVAADAMIDKRFTLRNFNAWRYRGETGNHIPVLAVSESQTVILRWDLSHLKGRKIKRAGLLELSPHSVQRSPEFQKDFGMVRITEIIGGTPDWDEATVTYETLKGNSAIEGVINTQMIIDDSVTWNKDGKVHFTISQPVLQRLVDGKTHGLAILPLGAVNALFYARENGGTLAAKLYIDAEIEK